MKPNQLTTLRLILLFAIIFANMYQFYFLALVFLLLALLTDFLDGHVARRYRRGSNFGVYYDHFVDKIFVHLLLIYYLSHNLIPFWIVALLILRDYLALGLRQYAISQDIVLASMMSGKIKLGMQGIFLVLVSMRLMAPSLEAIISVFGWLVVTWSLISLVDLGRKNKVLLKRLWDEF